MKLSRLTLLLAVVLSGCFSPSPGGIQGVWQFQQDFDAPSTFVTETIEFVINGNEIVRILEQDIRSKQTGSSVVLRSRQKGVFSVSPDVPPSSSSRMSVTSIEEIEYPSDSAFSIAGAILGNTAVDQEIFFGETMDASFRSRALFARDADELRIKFGLGDFPAALAPPSLIELRKVFRLFP